MNKILKRLCCLFFLLFLSEWISLSYAWKYDTIESQFLMIISMTLTTILAILNIVNTKKELEKLHNDQGKPL
jgi:hypothetical protein